MSVFLKFGGGTKPTALFGIENLLWKMFAKCCTHYLVMSVFDAQNSVYVHCCLKHILGVFPLNSGFLTDLCGLWCDKTIFGQ